MTLANWITLSRLLMVPLLVWAWRQPSPWLNGLLLLGLVGVTDLLDGYMARKRNEISELGKILDPIADKAVIASVLLTLVFRGIIPSWLVWVYLAKEGIQLFGGMLLLAKTHHVIPSNIWGKVSSSLFYIGFFLSFIWREGGVAMIITGLLLSMVAMATYFAAATIESAKTTRS